MTPHPCIACSRPYSEHNLVRCSDYRPGSGTAPRICAGCLEAEIDLGMPNAEHWLREAARLRIAAACIDPSDDAPLGDHCAHERVYALRSDPQRLWEAMRLAAGDSSAA